MKIVIVIIDSKLKTHNVLKSLFWFQVNSHLIFVISSFFGFLFYSLLFKIKILSTSYIMLCYTYTYSRICFLRGQYLNHCEIHWFFASSKNFLFIIIFKFSIRILITFSFSLAFTLVKFCNWNDWVVLTRANTLLISIGEHSSNYACSCPTLHLAITR